MDIATHQRALLKLFRSDCDQSACADDYICRVAQSRDLQEAKRNILLWRIYVLERTAPLTVNLLKQRGQLAAEVASFIARCNISPFRETQAPAFLEGLSESSNTLTRSVAQFELALLRVREGDCGRYVVCWDVEPHSVLHSLATNAVLPGAIPVGAYQVVVSRDCPDRLQIFSV